MFIQCLILSARECHGISGRFTTNGLELKHNLHKKVIAEDKVPKKVVKVSKAFKNFDTVILLRIQRGNTRPS